MEFWTQSKKNIFVAAHRGWCELYPENTMLAFRKAIEIGVDQIETDVRITLDGELSCWMPCASGMIVVEIKLFH